MGNALALGALLLLLAVAAQAQTVVIYSRADAAQAGRVQALAKVFGPSLVDRQLNPGVPWRQVMAESICTAGLVLLLWSERAAASTEVRREIDTALTCQRRVVPVLLDDTALPGVIADLNAVDWRP